VTATAPAGRAQRPPNPLATAVRGHLHTVFSRFQSRLHDPRFWVVQILVIAISAGHSLIEATHGALPDVALLPVSAYFIPIIFAALNFGVEGAVATALWSALLTVPNLILWHTGAQRPAVVLQLLLLIAIGYVVARRVDSETAAKERAEAANARLEDYVRLATDAQEEERKRLARELHDDAIQTLVIAKTDLDAVAAEGPAATSMRARLQALDATLTAAIDDMRRFSRDLRPSLLDDLGLVQAVDWLVGDLAARTAIDAQLHTSGQPRRLAQKDELALFRIVQEALRNVERHAEASTVEVCIEFGEHGDVRATVVDDGRGFDTSQPLPDRRSSSGLGLLGMRERAKLAGAALTITSRPSAGASVTVTLGSEAQSRSQTADRTPRPAPSEAAIAQQSS
jgi:two-component system, NarL family, sensor histidine kinase DegS